MLILIDNYDSFTYNLVHYLGELGSVPEVVRNDKITVAAALGNAVFDAIGVRLRRVPFTAARVKAALAGG